MQDKEDRDLDLFFSSLKENDKHIPTPQLPEFSQRKFRLWKLIPVGIAAALIAAIWMGTEVDHSPDLANDVIIISLIEDENQQQRFVIEQTSSIDVWESPTASLLDIY